MEYFFFILICLWFENSPSTGYRPDLALANDDDGGKHASLDGFHFCSRKGFITKIFEL